MDPTAVAVLWWLVGLATGAGAALAAAALLRRRRRGRAPEPDPAAPAATGVTVPAGVTDVLAALRAAAVVLDRRDRVVSASPAAYAAGIVRRGVVASPALRALVRAVRRDGRVREHELDLPRGALGTETFAISARAAPLGRDLVLVLVEDRTEARRVDEVRRDFVANVSHELKTPVGALILLAEAVLGASDDPPAVRRFAGRMQHEGDRLSHLVQELIDLSRLQGADPLREPAEISLDHVVHEAVDRCRLAAQAKGIRIVSGGASGVSVLGDEEQLVMALRNLIDNAVNYSPEHTRVAIGVRRGADVVEISVTDQGIGIPEGDLQRIFERFYRVDPARSRATGGTGLGLSIVKHVVANHGGEVSVWSVEDAGSTFTVRLPVGTSLPDLDDVPDDDVPDGDVPDAYAAAERDAGTRRDAVPDAGRVAAPAPAPVQEATP